MNEEIKPVEVETGKTKQEKTRPALLSMLCMGSFVYFFLMSLLLFAGLFYSGWITRVTNQYISPENYTKAHTLLIFGAGFFLHGLAFAGIILIWNLRRAGYYFLGLSCLIISTYQLINPSAAISSTAIYIILILLFGIFYNRMH
jgi:hypothetical protein